MEEAKTVPEPVSGIEYYQIIRAQIEHEDNLINQRLSWFVAAQSFLFTAYAILLNAPSPMRVEKFVTQQDILFPLIPVVAIGMSLLIYTTIFAAMRAMANLRRLLESHLNEQERAVFPPVGPVSGSVAAHTTLAAPSSTERGASGPPISVATQPGQTELTRIPEERSSSASRRVSAFKATFETLYAGVPPPITASDPLSL